MDEALPAWIGSLESDRALLEPDRLRQRIDALDRLESHLVFGSQNMESGLRNRMEILRAGLEAANLRLYRSIRQSIRRGAGKEAMLAWSPAANPDAHARNEADAESYDHLDALLSGVLQLEEPAFATAELEPEMVFYQPTPARHIFELIARTGLAEGDVLVDLGSGLGHVPLLAAICTGADCVGIERESAYVDCARGCADALGVSNAAFVRQDARAADLSRGTVFYLYTPFTGTLLGEVLAALEREADARRIQVCTLGPCTEVVAREPWLERLGAPNGSGLACFGSV